MPRGYIGDRTHDSVIQFLVAGGVLDRSKDTIAAGAHVSTLDRLYDRVKGAGLFAAEQHVLESLLTVHPNKTMMGGA